MCEIILNLKLKKKTKQQLSCKPYIKYKKLIYTLVSKNNPNLHDLYPLFMFHSPENEGTVHSVD